MLQEQAAMIQPTAGASNEHGAVELARCGEGHPLSLRPHATSRAYRRSLDGVQNLTCDFFAIIDVLLATRCEASRGTAR
jgi:hypothetical protein